jgi:acetylornithine deacetylase
MESLKVTVRVGIALNETVEQAEKRFRGAIMNAVKHDPWLSKNPPKITRQAAGFGSSHIEDTHPLVEAVTGAAGEVFRSPAPVTGAPYGCDMSGWIRLAGVPTVLYGPGEIDCAHSPNEWASLNATTRAAQVMVKATERLLELDAGELRRLNSRMCPKPAKPRSRVRKR